MIQVGFEPRQTPEPKLGLYAVLNKFNTQLKPELKFYMIIDIFFSA